MTRRRLALIVGTVTWTWIAIWPTAFIMHIALANRHEWWGFPAFLMPMLAYVGITCLLSILAILAGKKR